MPTETEDAFVENSEPRSRSPKSIKLPLTDAGVIDWENTSEKHTKAFISAIKADPNGILDNIREEAGASSENPDEEPTGIADASVLTATNVIMVLEAIGITLIGPKFAPVLKKLHPVVAIKACTVSMEEIKPIMPAAKRIMKRYIPVKYLGQEYQDIAICAEHLLKLSGEKFKSCIELAIAIQNVESKNYNDSKSNARGVTIDGQPLGSNAA